MTGSKSRAGSRCLENAFHSFQAVMSNQSTSKARTLPMRAQRHRLFSKDLGLVEEE
jgi:hypothetical protein